MLTSRRLELTKSTLALDAFGNRGWITIPAGAIVSVVLGPNGVGDRVVEVRWEDQPHVMYATDLIAAGIEVEERAAAV